MEEHKITTGTKQSRTMDPRVILLNSIYTKDQTLSLRMAHNSTLDSTLLWYFWDTKFSTLYDHYHLLSLVKYFIRVNSNQFATFLNSYISRDIYQNAPFWQRKEILRVLQEAIDNGWVSNIGDIQYIIQNWPYTNVESTYDDSL